MASILALCFVAASIIAPVSAQSIEQAQRMEASGDWAGAAGAWRFLAETAPGDYRLWTSLGAALAHQDQYAEAIAAYNRAKAIAPRDPLTNFNLGLAYFKTKRLPDAVPPLRIASEAMPDRPQANLLLGMSLYGAGKFREAAEALQRSRAAGGAQTPEFFQVLATCYIKTKQPERARAELSALLKANPDSASTHLLLGEAEDAGGKTDEAKAQFRAAIAADSRFPDAHFGLGYLLWKDREYEAAESEFREEVKLDGTHAQALTYLGDVLLKRGQREEAVKFLTLAQKSNSRVWLTAFDLGIVAADRKEWATARRQFLRAAELEPGRTEPHYRLAQVYKAQGETAKAAEELRKVSTVHRQQEDSLVEKISGPRVQ